jgi:DNA-binding transcriptional ArsR family regulator
LTINRSVDNSPIITRRTASVHRLDAADHAGGDPQEEALDRTFFALCDPVRRAILQRLDQGSMLVSEIAAPFEISLQAVSRHIQVLVRAGLVEQERTGRISRCSLVAGPIFAAAVWINRYSKYWQEQFDLLAVTLSDIGTKRPSKRSRSERGPTKVKRQS